MFNTNMITAGGKLVRPLWTSLVFMTSLPRLLVHLDQLPQAQAYLTTLRSKGAVVNTAIAMACVEGDVKSHDSNQLQCFVKSMGPTKMVGPLI